MAGARFLGNGFRSHLSALLEIDCFGNLNAVGTRSQPHRFQRAGLDVFVDLLTADLPVFSELTDGHVLIRMFLQIRDLPWHRRLPSSGRPRRALRKSHTLRDEHFLSLAAAGSVNP